MRRIILLLGVTTFLSAAGWIKVYYTDTGYGWAEGRSVRQTTDGGYIITGTMVNSGDGSVEDCSVDLWLVKTDSAGDTMWTRTYGREGPYVYDEGLCVQQTTDGGYIVTGYTNGKTYYAAGDLWLLKTDEYGDTEWTRTFIGDHSYDVDKGYWVEQTSDGGYIVTGYMDRAYLWLIKTDKFGDTTWAKTYHGLWGYCVREIEGGGYIVSSSGGLLKTDADGDSLWLKPCDTWGEVEQTTDEGYILIGGVNIQGGTELRLTKTDADGDTLWTRTYGGPQDDGGTSVQQTTDGGYIVLGNTRSFGAGNWDIWLLKTDANGDTLWTRTFGGERYEMGYSVQQTTDGGYIITGSSGFWGTGVLLIKTDSLGYVGVAEPPVQIKSNWEVISPIGPQITLRYADRPQGFAASIFDATGRKVDELHSANHSGTIAWGTGYESGVYFIKPTGQGTTARVIIIH